MGETSAKRNTTRDDFPVQKLCELINRHGTTLCEDASACEFFLRNACGGEYKREVFVLVKAIKEDVVKDLLNPPQGLPVEAVFNSLAQRLHENLWLDKTAAQWAVQSWASALGLTVTTPLLEEDSIPRLVSQPAIKFQPTPTKAALPPKRLSSLNPLDHLRLLWWVLVRPQRLQAYRETFGQEDEVGNWLVSTLTWWPLLVPTLALGLEKLPYSAKAWLPDAYLLFSALLVGCWLLTGGLRTNRDVAVVLVVFVSGVMAGIVAGVLAVGMAVDVTVGVAYLVAGFVALVVAGFVAVVVAGDVAVVVAGVVAVSVAVGVALGVMVEMLGFVEGFVAGFVSGIVAGFVVDEVTEFMGNAIENSLNTGTSSSLARWAFLLLIAAHLFLIGLPLIGLINIEDFQMDIIKRFE
ncbi:MAG: hypothetical protein DRR08_16660 [Candidatus Parabeggiatoa sp. nov. 2]|nr:MAG: hypothetical protein B6247_17235 [Beggiatoa sp. 4572_84]RKZ58345.1 MAG: hypothetical protein DRR08_16660 [Gammaproteobacteria bacterium]